MYSVVLLLFFWLMQNPKSSHILISHQIKPKIPTAKHLCIVLTFFRFLLNQHFRFTIMSESTVKPVEDIGIFEEFDGKAKLRKWLNMNFRIEMTDGRVLIGIFLCTDRDANVILGGCSEYLKSNDGEAEEPRVLGLVMVPGRHIVSIQLDDTTPPPPPPKYYYDE